MAAIKSKDIIYKNKDWLYHQYIELNKSSRQIAKEIGFVCGGTIRKWNQKFGFKKEKPIYHNREWLYDQYIIQYKSARQIEQEQGINGVIGKWLKKLNIPIRNMEGENHWNWKGGRNINSGYISIKTDNHPRADKHGYLLEHIIIMEKHLGRLLNEEEIVHHKDYNRTNNNIKNLWLAKNRSQHAKAHESFRKIGRGLAIKELEKGNIIFDEINGIYKWK